VIARLESAGRAAVPAQPWRGLERTATLRLPGLAALLAASCVVAAAAVSAYYAFRVNTWAVMTDELQVARLAISIAQGGSPIPTIRGEYYGAHSQLYPLLLAPFYGALSAPQAAAAAHVLNALLLASAAIPAFLLARSVTGNAGAGYAAALLTAVTPWLALSSTLLTENAAYAAFTWSLYFCQQALARPNPRRDAAALAGLALAFFARTQLVLLALALPLALLLYELGPARRGSMSVGRAAAATIRRHRVLAGAYGAGLLFSGLLLAAGRIGGVVGNYARPFEGNLVPDGFLGSAAAHFDQVALGVGVLPVVLSVSWIVTTALHPGRREAGAFAALFAVLVPFLVFEVTSFDLRFTRESFIQDRYLVYLVPLFAVGCVAWLAAARSFARTRLLSAAVVGAGLMALLELMPDRTQVIFWASPAAAFRPAIADAAAWLHVSDTVLVQAVTALALVVVLTASRAPRTVLVGTTVALTAFGAAQAGYVLERYVEPAMVRADATPRDWIDRAVPSGQAVTLVPGGTDGPVGWWEAELWNKDVDRTLQIDDGRTFTPFPVVEASVDREAGRLVGPHPSRYVVVSEAESRFGLAGAELIARSSPLELVRVRHAYRLAWSALGLTRDGWMRPGRPASVRVYGHSDAGRRSVVITLAASSLALRPADFEIITGDKTVRGTVDPGGARPPVEITVCVPAGGHADVWLLSRRGTTLEDGRVVSVHVDRLGVSPSRPCAAS
jgi:hypothetical protein